MLEVTILHEEGVLDDVPAGQMGSAFVGPVCLVEFAYRGQRNPFTRQLLRQLHQASDIPRSKAGRRCTEMVLFAHY